MLKVGGTVSCGNQIDPMSYVFLKLPKQEFNVCSVGIFTCTCNKDYGIRLNPLEASYQEIPLDGVSVYSFSFNWSAPDEIRHHCQLCQSVDYDFEWDFHQPNEIKVTDFFTVTASDKIG